MTDPPDRPRQQPGRPRSAGEDRHPRLWTRARWRLLGIEPAQAGDEALGIPAAIGMMRSDELSAPPPDVRRPAPVVLGAAVCHVAPVDDDGDFRSRQVLSWAYSTPRARSSSW